VPVSSAVQLTFDGLPLDPNEVARLLALERAALDRELQLDPLQVASIEQAVRLVIAGTYMRRKPR
jgi:hypothetical protein